MKKLSFLLTTLLFTSCATTTFTTNSTRDNWRTMNGNIKSISKTAYTAVDSAGVWIKGKRLTKTLDHFKPYQGNRSYFFNKKGQIVKEVYQPFVGDKMVFLQQYNQNGKLSKLTALEKGELQYWQTMQYDKRVNKMIMKTYRPDSSVTRPRVFKYNDQGKKIEERYYGDAKTPQIIYRFDYNKKGLRTSKKVDFVDNGQQDFKFLYRYDKNGHRTLFKWVSKEELFSKSTYKYNQEGDCILQRNFNAQGKQESTTTMTYKYDKKGNWIQKSILKNKNHRLIIAREIEYY